MTRVLFSLLAIIFSSYSFNAVGAQDSSGKEAYAKDTIKQLLGSNKFISRAIGWNPLSRQRRAMVRCQNLMSFAIEL